MKTCDWITDEKKDGTICRCGQPASWTAPHARLHYCADHCNQVADILRAYELPPLQPLAEAPEEQAA